MVIAGTGHRPNKLGGYSDEAFNNLVNIAENTLKKNNVNEVISGMALGWDMALAQAAINLNIPFIAAIPFKGQELKWVNKSQEYYRELLIKAKKIEVISEGEYSSDKMQIRNEWMVNHCDLVLTMYNGDTFGGTFNCIKYAIKINKPMVNLFDKLK